MRGPASDRYPSSLAKLGLKARDRRFHFLVLGENETEEAKVKQLTDAGKFTPGDEHQVVRVPWTPKPLRGSKCIPEGSVSTDEPEMPRPEPAVTSWGEGDREQRWREHIRKIERDGTRYDPDRSKRSNGVY